METIQNIVLATARFILVTFEVCIAACLFVAIDNFIGLDPKSDDAKALDNLLGALWAILYLRVAKPYCYMWPRLSQRGIELTFWYDTEVRPYLDADLAERGLEMTEVDHAILRYRLIKLQLSKEWDYS